MKIERLEEHVTLPEGVSASYDAPSRMLTVKGAKGELQRKLYHPRITFTTEAGKITLLSLKATIREKKQLFTFKSHITNMAKGVTEGFVNKLKICSGHFPMSVTMKGQKLR